MLTCPYEHRLPDCLGLARGIVLDTRHLSGACVFLGPNPGSDLSYSVPVWGICLVLLDLSATLVKSCLTPTLGGRRQCINARL